MSPQLQPLLLLLLLLLVPAAAAPSQLLAGAAKVDATPPVGAPLAPYNFGARRVPTWPIPQFTRFVSNATTGCCPKLLLLLLLLLLLSLLLLLVPPSCR